MYAPTSSHHHQHYQHQQEHQQYGKPRAHAPLARRHSSGRTSQEYASDSQQLCQDYISRRLAPLALADNMSSRQSVAFSSYSRRTPTGETLDEGFEGRLSRCSTTSSIGSWASTNSLQVDRQKRRLTSDIVDDIVQRIREIPHSSQSLANIVRRIVSTHDDTVAENIRAFEMLIGDGETGQTSRPIRPSPTWRSADLQVVEALQELHSLKAGLFNSPQHQTPAKLDNATVTYEIIQTNFKQSEFIAFAALPGGSCYGSLQACPTRGEARRSAACVALVHAAWNEIPSKILTDSNIDGLVKVAQSSKSRRPSRASSTNSIFSNPPCLDSDSSCAETPTPHHPRPVLQKQASVCSGGSMASIDSGCCSASGATTPLTPYLNTLEEEPGLPGPGAQSWQSVDILRHLLKMYRGRTAMDFRARMTVFQLMQWSGDLQRAKSKGLAFEHVLQAYFSTPLDDKLRSYLAKMWARKEVSERGIITQALKTARRELDILRINGSELSFVKEKKSVLVNAFALFQRQQAALRQEEAQSPMGHSSRGRKSCLSRTQSSGMEWYS